MTIFDKNVKKSMWRYLFQCALATFTISAVLFFLDVLNETAIIAALGASAFTVFTMPTSYYADTRRLVGGYILGLSVGYLFYYLSNSNTFGSLIISPKISFVVFGSLSVGITMFLMTVTNTEHAPAAGIALGLVVNEWDYLTIVFILIAIVWMTSMHRILKSILIDL